jgi:hypothetical protein
MALDYRALWDAAIPWHRFLNPAMELYSLWSGIYQRVKAPEWAIARARALGPIRFLVINGDWCWDGANIVPWVVRLAESIGTDVRTAIRDENVELMNQYLTNGSGSIPIVIGLDDEFQVRGHWGPRPAELQAWVLMHRSTMPRDQRYAEMRRWYLKDNGTSTLGELLTALEKGA